MDLLNKLLPYSGHGLKAIYEEDIKDVFVSSSGTNSINAERLMECHYKPILFSPGCLTKEIQTEHGKEIPMIEMAKIAYESCSIIKTFIQKITLTKGGYVRIVNNYGASCVFQPCIFYPWFAIEFDARVIQFDPIPVLDYLYSRHIAFNLMLEEYVSVESLKKNPYGKDNTLQNK